MEEGVVKQLLVRHLPLIKWHASRYDRQYSLPNGEALSVCYETFMKGTKSFKDFDPSTEEGSMAFGKYLGSSLRHELASARAAAMHPHISVPINVAKSAAMNREEGYDIDARVQRLLSLTYCDYDKLDDLSASEEEASDKYIALHDAVEKLKPVQKKIMQLMLLDCDGTQQADAMGGMSRALLSHHRCAAIDQLKRLLRGHEDD